MYTEDTSDFSKRQCVAILNTSVHKYLVLKFAFFIIWKVQSDWFNTFSTQSNIHKYKKCINNFKINIKIVYR